MGRKINVLCLVVVFRLGGAPLGPVHTMPTLRGEASLFQTKLCREEKPLG